jgi:hypothetical protein
MSPWEWIKKHLSIAFDKYVGRWTNIWVNMVLFALFAPVAFFLEHGWPRDLWWMTAGCQLGYIFMWLTYPRFNKARQLEMEVEISRILSESLYRMTRETFGLMTLTEAEKDNDKPPGRRLQ